MVSISVTIFYALLCSPVRAALQASMREAVRAGDIREDADEGKKANKAEEMPGEATCSGNAKICPNTGQQFIEPSACRLGEPGNENCAPSIQIISATTSLEDIGKEMSAGHEQRELGVYAAAASHYINARELAKGLEDKLHVVEASRNLATVWLFQGKLVDALNELLNSLTLMKTTSQLHALGNVHREMGHMSKALELYEEARKLAHVLPQVSIDMGETHARLGSFDTAAKHVQEALDNLEQGSFDAARARALDGFIHLSRGDAKGGFAKLNDARNIQSQALHVGHPDLVLTQMHLARALRDMGSVDAALAAAESLERTLRDSLSEELQLSRALTQKAVILQELERIAEAEEAMKEAFMLQTRVFGGQALPQVAEALNIYGSILHDKGDIRGAQLQYNQALAMNMATVGEWHPETAAVHNSLGTLYKDKGKLAKAHHHLKQCLEIQLRTLGENNPEIASTLNNMATVEFEQGRHAEAEMSLETALSLLDAAQVPEGSPDRVAYAENLKDIKKFRAH